MSRFSDGVSPAVGLSSTPVSEADGHVPATGRSWPAGWEKVGILLRERLKKRLGASSVAFSVSGNSRRIAWELGSSPENISKSDWDRALSFCMAGKKSLRTALSYLSALLVREGIWPKEFIPPWIRTEVVLDNLPPEWQYLFRTLNDKCERQGVTHQIKLRWIRAMTCFVFQWNIPAKGEIELSALERQWNEYLDSRPVFLGILASPGMRASLQRGFCALCNALVRAGRAKGASREFDLVDTGFWRPVGRDVRPAAHRVFPVPHGPGRSSLREPLARYVLLRVLNFDSALPNRPLQLRAEELEKAAERLRQERFSETAVRQALDDVSRILSVALDMDREEA